MPATSRKLTHPVLLFTAVSLAACSTPALYDARLQPIHEPVLYAELDFARLAVDSTETGIRAVVEMHVEGDEWAGDYLALHMPVLECGADGQHMPARVHREQPNCMEVVPQTICEEAGASPDLCGARVVGRENRCVYVIRAEYVLTQVPRLEEPFTLTFGQSASSVFWARAKP